jgi:hypothetical protein
MQRHRAVPRAFKDRIATEKARVEAQLAEVPHGPERDALFKKIRQLETATRINDWLASPGLQPPT